MWLERFELCQWHLHRFPRISTVSRAGQHRPLLIRHRDRVRATAEERLMGPGFGSWTRGWRCRKVAEGGLGLALSQCHPLSFSLSPLPPSYKRAGFLPNRGAGGEGCPHRPVPHVVACFRLCAGTHGHLPHTASVHLASHLSSRQAIIVSATIKVPSHRHTLLLHFPRAREEFVDPLL